jgi:hypothetical protein
MKDINLITDNQRFGADIKECWDRGRRRNTFFRQLGYVCVYRASITPCVARDYQGIRNELKRPVAD